MRHRQTRRQWVSNHRLNAARNAHQFHGGSREARCSGECFWLARIQENKIRRRGLLWFSATDLLTGCPQPCGLRPRYVYFVSLLNFSWFLELHVEFLRFPDRFIFFLRFPVLKNYVGVDFTASFLCFRTIQLSKTNVCKEAAWLFEIAEPSSSWQNNGGLNFCAYNLNLCGVWGYFHGFFFL